MKHDQRAAFERFLLGERRQLQQAVERAEAAPTALPRLGDEAAPGSSGASSDDDRAVAAHAARELVSIDAALRRLHDAPADYGMCSVCGMPISLARLRVVPGTSLCQTHAI